MFSSRFESLSKLPKPFGLFDKKNQNTKGGGGGDGDGDGDDKTIREGFDPNTPPASKNPSLTDDVPAAKTFLVGIMFAVFCILFVIIGLVYYFNSNILLTQSLMISPFYNKTNFWTRFKGKLVASKMFIFLLLWMVIFCSNLLLLDTVFKNHEYENIFFVSTIYYWSIVGSTMLLIGNIPSLVDVFENTIGFSVLGTPLFNLSRVMSMFKNRNFKSDEFKISYDFLITTFDIPSFHDYFNKLWYQYPNNAEYNGANPTKVEDKSRSDFYIDLNTWLIPESQLGSVTGVNRNNDNVRLDDNKANYARRELLKCVLTKNTIGHFIWVLLSSYIVVLLTLNTVVQ